MNIIADMWRYAEGVYHEDLWVGVTPPKMPELVGAIITPMISELDSGYIADFPDRIIIAFRGTKDLKAWISDADVYPLRSDFDLNGGTLCDGFYTGWAVFKDTITNYIKTNRKDNVPIICTGHSRGGVLSVLCARHIAKNMGIPCSCIGFAGPMPGNGDARDEIDMLPINLTRVTNGNDIVPTLPPYSLGFRQPGKILAKKGRWGFFTKIRDHYQSEYTTSIINYSKSKKDEEAVTILKEVLKRADHPKSWFWPF